MALRENHDTEEEGIPTDLLITDPMGFPAAEVEGAKTGALVVLVDPQEALPTLRNLQDRPEYKTYIAGPGSRPSKKTETHPAQSNIAPKSRTAGAQVRDIIGKFAERFADFPHLFS